MRKIVIDVEVFFDYTCGFSNRARHWLDALDGVQVVWRPFSLLEQNRAGTECRSLSGARSPRTSR